MRGSVPVGPPRTVSYEVVMRQDDPVLYVVRQFRACFALQNNLEKKGEGTRFRWGGQERTRDAG